MRSTLLPSCPSSMKVCLRAGAVAALAVACGSGSPGGGQTTKIPAPAGITPISVPPARIVPDADRLCLVAHAPAALMPAGVASVTSTNLLVDHDYVYFTVPSDSGPYHLYRVSKSGAVPPENLAPSDAQALVTDGTTIFAADSLAHVQAFPASGAATPSGTSAGAAVTPDALYVVIRTDEIDGALVKVPRSGALATWAEGVGNASPWSLLADAGTLFWQSSFWFGPVAARGPSGDVRAVTDSSVYFPNGMAVDDDRLYLAVKDTGVVAMAKSGGPPTTLLAGVDAKSVYRDGASLYWTDSQGIHAMATSGGDSRLVAPIASPSQVLWGALAVDEDCVYYVVQDEKNEMALMTAPKRRPIQ
jgi:hypothetical protein